MSVFPQYKPDLHNTLHVCFLFFFPLVLALLALCTVDGRLRNSLVHTDTNVPKEVSLL